MATLLAVDPGKRGVGAAVFTDGRLTAAAYVPGAKVGERADAWRPMVEATVSWCKTQVGGVPDELAIEMMQVYVRGRSKGAPADLLDLQAIVGICCALPCKARVYLPAEHKAQVPKAIQHERALKRLDDGERAAIELPKAAKTLAHNVWDAIGIGLVHLGRLG